MSAAQVGAVCVSAAALLGCYTAGACGTESQPRAQRGWKRGVNRGSKSPKAAASANTAIATHAHSEGADSGPASTLSTGAPVRGAVPVSSAAACLAEWEKLKADGNSQMKNKEFAKAVALYERAITALLAAEGENVVASPAGQEALAAL